MSEPVDLTFVGQRGKGCCHGDEGASSCEGNPLVAVTTKVDMRTTTVYLFSLITVHATSSTCVHVSPLTLVLDNQGPVLGKVHQGRVM